MVVAVLVLVGPIVQRVDVESVLTRSEDDLGNPQFHVVGEKSPQLGVLGKVDKTAVHFVPGHVVELNAFGDNFRRVLVRRKMVFFSVPKPKFRRMP